MANTIDHSQTQSKELDVISHIIDANPTICELLLQDLNRGKFKAQRSDGKTINVEQVLCVAVKILLGFKYDKLAFSIIDSQSVHWFRRLRIADDWIDSNSQKTLFRSSALQCAREVRALNHTGGKFCAQLCANIVQFSLGLSFVCKIKIIRQLS